MAYEGLLHSDVALSIFGIPFEVNLTAAALSQDGLHVLIKNYQTVWQFTRNDLTTTMLDLLQTTPTRFAKFQFIRKKQRNGSVLRRSRLSTMNRSLRRPKRRG